MLKKVAKISMQMAYKTLKIIYIYNLTFMH